MLRSKLKGSLKSKTIWFGILVMAVTWMQNNTDVLVGMFPAQYGDLVGYLVGIVIWVFRWITSTSLEEKGDPPKKREPTTAKERWDEELKKNDLNDS